jgi:hypothetical protein
VNEHDLHTLLMPPHPGNVYNASALCSCGKWQFDSPSENQLFGNYGSILRGHAIHKRKAIREQEWFNGQRSLHSSTSYTRGYGGFPSRRP